MLSNTSLVEALWFLIASVGLVASAFDLHRGYGDVRRHWRAKGDPVRGIAISGAVKSSLLAIITVLNLLVGVMASVTPEPVRDSLNTYQSATAVALIAVQMLTVSVIIVKDWERKYVGSYIWVAYPGKERRIKKTEADSLLQEVSRE